MKDNSSYKMFLLPNETIIQENNLTEEKKKTEINNIENMKIICKDIEEIVKYNHKNVNHTKIKQIINELTPYDKYFNQHLLNREEYNWSSDEFFSYYHYYKFKLFLMYVCNNSCEKMKYYRLALKVFTDIYQQLQNYLNISVFEKIRAITSLYIKLKNDCEHKENKNSIIGEFRLLNMDDNKNEIECYKLAYDFVLKIIDNLKENSFIFLPLLQVNSGFSKNINSNDERNIFELSMINVEMIKRHLKSLLPKLIFVVNHPTIKSKRGSMDKVIGNIFIYESSIFHNNINKETDEIAKNYPKDAAVIVSFVLLHEIFMHKKLRASNDFIPGKETPSKFIGPKFNIKNFYYSDKKGNSDPLSIYTKNQNKLNKIPEEGECGKILEYFFENEKFEIIKYLKKYIGFGDLLDKVDLIVDENLDKLHSYIKDKIADGSAKLLYKDKKSKNNNEIINLDEDDEDKIMKSSQLEEENEQEEEDEEEEESDEKSEETKRLMKLEIIN